MAFNAVVDNEEGRKAKHPVPTAGKRARGVRTPEGRALRDRLEAEAGAHVAAWRADRSSHLRPPEDRRGGSGIRTPEGRALRDRLEAEAGAHVAAWRADRSGHLRPPEDQRGGSGAAASTPQAPSADERTWAEWWQQSTGASPRPSNQRNRERMNAARRRRSAQERAEREAAASDVSADAPLNVWLDRRGDGTLTYGVEDREVGHFDGHRATLIEAEPDRYADRLGFLTRLSDPAGDTGALIREGRDLFYWNRGTGLIDNYNYGLAEDAVSQDDAHLALVRMRVALDRGEAPHADDVDIVVRCVFPEFSDAGFWTEMGLAVTPGAGEAISLSDANRSWDDAGRAWERGHYARAAGNTALAGLNVVGAVPLVGAGARGAKRAAQGAVRNLPRVSRLHGQRTLGRAARRYGDEVPEELRLTDMVPENVLASLSPRQRASLQSYFITLKGRAAEAEVQDALKRAGFTFSDRQVPSSVLGNSMLTRRYDVEPEQDMIPTWWGGRAVGAGSRRPKLEVKSDNATTSGNQNAFTRAVQAGLGLDSRGNRIEVDAEEFLRIPVNEVGPSELNRVARRVLDLAVGKGTLTRPQSDAVLRQLMGWHGRTTVGEEVTLAMVLAGLARLATVPLE